MKKQIVIGLATLLLVACSLASVQLLTFDAGDHAEVSEQQAFSLSTEQMGAEIKFSNMMIFSGLYQTYRAGIVIVTPGLTLITRDQTVFIDPATHAGFLTPPDEHGGIDFCATLRHDNTGDNLAKARCYPLIQAKEYHQWAPYTPIATP